jgi:protein phosphatase
MELIAWGQTDVGLRREINQDSIFLDSDLGLFVVADGMGGHKGGEVASALAVDTVREIVSSAVYNNDPIHPRDLLTFAYREASARIYHKSTRESPELMGMGTTMVAGLLHSGKRLYIANVGDSRAYMLRGDYLWQLTEDHSQIYELVKAGALSQAEADRMLGRNVITRSVGFEKSVQVDIIERELDSRDTYMFCSDGLSSMIPDAAIAKLLMQSDAENSVAQCIEAARKAGGDDNISVLVIQVRS